MTAKFKKRIDKRKKKIAERLKNDGAIGCKPVMDANRIRYELSKKVDATTCGGQLTLRNFPTLRQNVEINTA